MKSDYQLFGEGVAKLSIVGTHRPCNAVQITESRRLGGVTIPVRRVAEGGATATFHKVSPWNGRMC